MLQVAENDFDFRAFFAEQGAAYLGEQMTEVVIYGYSYCGDIPGVDEYFHEIVDCDVPLFFEIRGTYPVTITDVNFPTSLVPTEMGQFSWTVRCDYEALLGDHGETNSVGQCISAINDWLAENWDYIERFSGVDGGGVTASSTYTAGDYDFQGDDTVYFDYSPDAEFVSAWYEHDEENNFSGEERYDLIFNYDNEWGFSGSSEYHSVVRAEQDMNLMLRGLAEDISIIQPETPEDFEDIAVKYGLARDF